MTPVGFEPTISAGERPQIYALDRAATGIDVWVTLLSNKLLAGVRYFYKLVLLRVGRVFNRYAYYSLVNDCDREM